MSKRITKNQAHAIETRDALVAAISLRVQKLTDRNEHVATEWARITKSATTDGFTNQLALLKGGIDLAPLLAAIPRHKSETDKNGYVQAKTVEKVMKVINAFATQTSDAMGDYVVQVIYNALHNGGSLSLNGAQASLSKRVSNEGSSEALKSRGNYTPGTASSQASQVREVVRMLDLGETTKGKRNDIMTLHPKRVEQLREIFNLDGQGEDHTEEQGETTE